MKGGPALHEEDMGLLVNGVLKTSHVYTLRKGEVVRNVDETLMALEREMIKIKGQGKTWSCIFYDAEKSTCTIYEDRPRECRALKCWDLRHLKEVMDTPLLQRKDLINPGDGILKIIDAHEERCSYTVLESKVKELQKTNADKAVEKILGILQYDDDMRPFVVEKLSIDLEVMDFLFGRPLTKTIHMFGLRVEQAGNTFTLLPID
jgi:Fe-S-cluster containining protein